MTGFEPPDAAGAVATWVAALATIVVLGGLIGERRAFGWAQHLFAGLVTGFLALVAISEVIVPRVLAPLAADPGGHGELWLGLGVVALAAGAPWLPRPLAAIPVSIAIGALAAFALGGAVVGTLLPQLNAAVARPQPSSIEALIGIGTAVVTGLVLLAFLHGSPRGKLLSAGGRVGRWLLVAGLGGWLGYLLFARLILLNDRLAFLLGDWLGLGR